SAKGYAPQTATVNLANGATITRNFVLNPIAVIEPNTISVTAESCALNSAAEPGETVTINLPLKNTGAADLNNVTVTLQEGGGVINPSSPQNYGNLLVGGPAVSRSFTFTISPNLSCGTSVGLGLQITATSAAASVVVGMPTGTPRLVMNEPFMGPRS